LLCSLEEINALTSGVFMSVFKMGMLTIIIAMGVAGYAYCNWPNEKMRLNDYKSDDVPGTVTCDLCPDCGYYSVLVGVCWNENCRTYPKDKRSH
jgi:hypothetical protein